MSEEEEKKARSKFTPLKKAEARELWETASMTLDGIAAHIGIGRSSVSRYFKEAGIKHGARLKEAEEELRRKMLEESAAKAALHLERVSETKDQHYSWATAIARLTMAQIIKAQKDKASLASVANEIKTLEKVTAVLHNAMQQRYKALGIDKIDEDPGDLPELLVTELTANEIEEMRNQKDEDDADDLSDEERELAEALEGIDDDVDSEDGGLVIEGE